MLRQNSRDSFIVRKRLSFNVFCRDNLSLSSKK